MYMKRQPIGSMLEDWYGRDRAQAERIRFLPGAVPLTELVERIAKKALPYGMMEFGRIEDAWPQIAGAEISAKAKPFRLDGNKLLVEVSHPAWLSHFKSSGVRKALLDRMSAVLVDSPCKDIVFILQGRRAPEAE
jgi:hypothetical protein